MQTTGFILLLAAGTIMFFGGQDRVQTVPTVVTTNQPHIVVQ